MRKSEIERLERLYRDQMAAFDKWTAAISQPIAGFITGDWSVTYPVLAPEPKRDVFPRAAMTETNCRHFTQ